MNCSIPHVFNYLFTLSPSLRQLFFGKKELAMVMITVNGSVHMKLVEGRGCSVDEDVSGCGKRMERGR